MTNNLENISIIEEIETENIEEKINVVKDRLKIYSKNSIVWCTGDLYEVKEENNIKINYKWDVERILQKPRDENKRCHFTSDFLELKSGQFFFKCLICNKKFNYYLSSPSGSEFFKHIITEHQFIIPEYKKVEKGKYCNYSSNDDPMIYNAHILLTCSLISTHSSFNMVEDDFFKMFISTLNSQYTIPSRTTISEKIIPDMTKIIKNKILEEIRIIESICLSLDGWCCPYSHKKVYSTTAHYLVNGKMYSRILKLELFNEESTSSNISKFIKETIQEWEMDRFGEILILSDNAPEMKAGILESGNIFIGCCCHRHNLVVNYSVENSPIVKKLIDKCKKITTKFKTSYSLNNMLTNIQMELYGNYLLMVNDCITRWFSEKKLVNRVLENSSVTNGIVEALVENIESDEMKECFMEEYYLKDEEINILKFFVECLEKIEEESLVFEKDTEATLSFVIPSYCSLVEYFKNLMNSMDNEENNYDCVSISITANNQLFRSFEEFEFSTLENKNEYHVELNHEFIDVGNVKKDFVEKIIEGMEKKFVNDNNIFENMDILLSTVLNPYFKLDFFNQSEIQKVNNYFQMVTNNQSNEKVGRYDRGRKSNTNQTRSEFDVYLNQGCLSNDYSFDNIIKYWEVHKYSFPNLYKTSKRYFCALSSSCSSERLFSDASNYLTNKRSRMIISTVESQCIIRSFINQNGIEFFMH